MTTMTAYLSFSSEKKQERVPCRGITTIGRDKGNDVVLSDLQVSRSHGIVRRLGESDFYFMDGGSSNGSKVNGRRITGPVLLGNGDRITIGGTEFVFEQEVRSAAFVDSVSFQSTIIVRAPVIREITILVADIRGFTSLSEQLPIQTLSQVMNRWFERVSDIIGKCAGTVDKFIGDCVFARWEHDTPRENVVNALRAACRISSATSGLSASFRLSTPLRIGAGINTGLASLGVGSENTALGDAVNTAFRLESATKEVGADIVLSESSCSCLPEHWPLAVTSVKVKGKSQPVKVVGLAFGVAERLLEGAEKG